MKFVATSALMNNPDNRGAYSEAIQSNAGKGRNSANFALITFERCCKMTHFVYHWSRFMENKMAVSHFTDNKFGIHVSRETKFLYDQFCLFWLRTTAKELPCSMSPPFSRCLFLVLWKGNRVLCLEVEAPHHLLIQKHCHPRGRYRIQRAGLL